MGQCCTTSWALVMGQCLLLEGYLVQLTGLRDRAMGQCLLLAEVHVIEPWASAYYWRQLAEVYVIPVPAIGGSWLRSM